VEHTVELFCGPEKPFSSIASFLGYQTTTVDDDPNSGADIIAPASENDPRFPSAPTMIWMAPPTAGFEDKAGWDNFSPVTEVATLAEEGIRRSLRLARQMQPKWWFMEAPKSYLRKLPLMAGFNRGDPSRIRYTIDPKNYGGTGKKEIDVWTNAFWWTPLSRAEGTIPETVPHAANDRRVPPYVYLEMFNQYDAYLRNKGERS
jgi:hypothetical protein